MGFASINAQASMPLGIRVGIGTLMLEKSKICENRVLGICWKQFCVYWWESGLVGKTAILVKLVDALNFQDVLDVSDYCPVQVIFEQVQKGQVHLSKGEL